MSFERGELEKMQTKGLLRLADYLGIRYNEKTKRSKIIDNIMLELAKRSEPYKDYGSSEPLPEVPKYSVRVKRIMEMKEKGEL